MNPIPRRAAPWTMPAAAFVLALLLSWGVGVGTRAARAAGAVSGSSGLVADPGDPTPGQIVVFTPPPGGVHYEWDFDYRAVFRPSYSSRRGGPLYRSFPFAGSFVVRCRVHNSVSGFFDDTVTIVVGPPGTLTATLSALPAAGTAPLDVTLTATPNPPGEYRYLWDFDDDGRWDATGTDPVMNHRYASSGGFSASVGVLAPDGAGASAKASVTVLPPAVFVTVTGLAASPTTARVGDTVTFTATVSGGTATEYLWDFDDDRRIDAVTLTGTAQWRYENAGSGWIRVGARNAAGVEVFSSFPQTVLVDPTVARCWLTSPLPGSTLGGNHISLQADYSPGIAPVDFQFFYRPSTGMPPPPYPHPSWILIGTVAADVLPRSGLHWDPSAFTPGTVLDLLVVARNVAGGVIASSGDVLPVAVTAASGMPDIQEFQAMRGAIPRPWSAEVLRQIPIAGGVEVEMSGDTGVTLGPEPPASGYAAWRLRRRSANPHPVEGTLQARTFDPDSFRSFEGVGGGPPSVPARVSRYLGGDGIDRLLGGRPIEDFLFTAYQFNETTREWGVLAEGIYHPGDRLLRVWARGTGDFAIGAVVLRVPSPGGGPCGLLGAEILLLLPLLRRRRSSRAV
jgi:PKD repeat protein